MTDGRRRWLRPLGWLVAILCLAWVVRPLAGHTRELTERIDGATLVAIVPVSALAYALLSTLLAGAWWWLLGLYEPRRTLRAAYSAWARSQLAKYLPSNALHLVGRQILGRELGFGHLNLAASAVLEMVGLFLAAAAIGSARTDLVVGRLGSWPLVLGLLVVGILVWPLADRVLRRLPIVGPRLRPLPQLGPRRTLAVLGPAVLLYAIFFLGTGLLLALLAGGGWGWERVDLGIVLPAYALAWMTGTVTVGAPGGVGVREAVLTLLLGETLGATDAAALALTLRVVTVGGDVLTAVGGWLARSSAKPPGLRQP